MKDNRRSPRYTMPARLTFASLHASGEGMLSNISSKGIAFFAPGEPGLINRSRILVSIAWPVRLNGTVDMTLNVCGRIVRTEGHLVCASISSYEFRTSARAYGATA